VVVVGGRGRPGELDCKPWHLCRIIATFGKRIHAKLLYNQETKYTPNIHPSLMQPIFPSTLSVPWGARRLCVAVMRLLVTIPSQ
jgi:hypothetical protein